MRSLLSWATLLPWAVMLVADVTSASTQSLPSCALQCLTDLLPQSECSATNQTCICTNVPLNEELTICVEANCTVKESLTTKNVTYTECGQPVRSRTDLSLYVPAIGLALSMLFVALRMYTRFGMTKLEFGLDDWMTILLSCCAVAVNAGSILLGQAGLGRDIWTLQFTKITRILYLFYIQEMLYISCVTLVKICFLLFYLRIFPSRPMRLVIKISCAVTLCYGLAFLFAFAFQCSPISYNWYGWDGEHHGSCVATNTMVVTAAALNIVLDVWVIALPLPMVMKLQASLTTKLQVMLMFSVGFLITGVGVYRAVMLKMFATSTDATWDNAAGGYWSVIEIDVGIICLCMPSMRTLLARLFPRVFGSTKGSSSMGHTISQKKIRTADSGRDTSFVQLIDMDHTGNMKHHPDAL